MNETARVACLVPGRVRGTLERDPARSGSDKVLLLRQAQLADLSAPPAGVVLVEAGLFSHALIQWLGHGVPTALIDGAQAERLEEHGPVLLDAARGEMRRWTNDEAPEPWLAPAAPDPGQPVETADGVAVRLTASVGVEAEGPWGLVMDGARRPSASTEPPR